VEVDEQEREDDAVPERVDERPELEHVDHPWQARVERTEIGRDRAHDLNLARLRRAGGDFSFGTGISMM
jgi:hypothetical protein